MDFDHVSGEKIMDVSILVNRGSTSRLLEEMAKCDVVCATCHRIRTFRRVQVAAPDQATDTVDVDSHHQLRLFDL